MTDDLAGWAADALGHAFADPALLRRAMTHPSAGQPNYQRLEFLGDRILGCVIAAWLYDDLDEAEGKLTARFHVLVDAPSCARVATAFGVPERLIMDRATRAAHVARSTNVLGDVAEALIAAIYLDAGWAAAEAFVRRAWAPLIDTTAAAPENPKSRLQEWAAAQRLGTPAYASDVEGRAGSPAQFPRFGDRARPRAGRGQRHLQTGSRKSGGAGHARKDRLVRAGTVAVVGAPNAGKSTLVNRIVGQKVAIVSAKVQTTRTRLMGIAVEGDTQLLLVDTPGIFAPRRRLDRAMVRAAWEGAADADLIACIVDAKSGLKADSLAVIEALAGRPEPKWLILNKVDIAKKPRLLDLAAQAGARARSRRPISSAPRPATASPS